MLLMISDASVLIDIEHGKLTNEMFSLPYQFAVPDILNVKVHGTLWLVEQMIYEGKITTETACAGFWRMRDSGSRLPWGDVEHLLEKRLVEFVVPERVEC